MSVEALVWASSRLFSSGLHGEVTEWDLNKLTAKVCYLRSQCARRFTCQTQANDVTCSLDMC